MNERNQQIAEEEWVSFPGGELQGKRPKSLCSACRTRSQPLQALCFQCYRTEVGRERALKAAGQLDTASPDRFQGALPFEAVNRPRLGALKVERVAARAAERGGVGRFDEKRRQAQISARGALRRIDAALEARQTEMSVAQRIMASAVHAAELQLPESWLPFVVAR
jgi:hypothetical protein